MDSNDSQSVIEMVLAKQNFAEKLTDHGIFFLKNSAKLSNLERFLPQIGRFLQKRHLSEIQRLHGPAKFF